MAHRPVPGVQVGVDELREAALQLAAVATARPPEAVRIRVLAHVAQTRQAP